MQGTIPSSWWPPAPSWGSGWWGWRPDRRGCSWASWSTESEPLLVPLSDKNNGIIKMKVLEIEDPFINYGVSWLFKWLTLIAMHQIISAKTGRTSQPSTNWIPSSARLDRLTSWSLPTCQLTMSNLGTKRKKMYFLRDLPSPTQTNTLENKEEFSTKMGGLNGPARFKPRY